MENKTITLIRKQATPFTVNYPYQLNNGGISPQIIFQGSVGGRLSEKEVPIEVFNWLRDFTSTFKSGMLVIKETKDEEIQELVEAIPNAEEMNKVILTIDEIKKMIDTGNQNVLKKALNDLVKDISEEDTVKEVKNYVYKTAIELGVDSSAKRKVICDWIGYNYEDVADNFDKTVE